MEQSQDKPTVGIIMGDPAGIGPEIALKSLATLEVYDVCCPVLIGDYDVLRERAERFVPKVSLLHEDASKAEDMGRAPFEVRVLEIGSDYAPIEEAVASEAAGRMILDSIRRGFRAVVEGDLDRLVLAPITKGALAKVDQGYASEFELFAELAEVDEVYGVIKWGSLFCTSVTGHVPFREILSHLTVPEIVDATRVLHATMADFGIKQPRLAVAALNPHAGERGLVGAEEQMIIAPAIESLVERGMDVQGPVPADVVFVQAMRRHYDGIVFLYHDQCNIAVKAVAFGEAILLYVGLPFIVTGLTHGTAYDIVEQGVANEGNMLLAIRVAATMTRKDGPDVPSGDAMPAV
ncbi:MAG: 4-hydroxythreonine-4-phosphate dehydrogenase PdxA [Chloroflexota bacterium]|nr:4-hydroxythreonine-4-phosphate dehydrogenase PdxA [Chloroflexota bacterium]